MLMFALLDLFLMEDLSDLIWLGIDEDSLDYMKCKLEYEQNYDLMVDLLKFIFQ